MYCVLNQKICITKDVISTLRPVIERYNIVIEDMDDVEMIVKTLMTRLGVTKEYEIWEDYRVKEVLGEKTCLNILETFFKIKGPHNSNDLLSNFDINKIMNQFTIHSKLLFGKNFLGLECQTIDFSQYKNDLRGLDTKTILMYDAVGCVLNTDVSTGRGKHWICFYIDNKTREILFFNSSSNGPPIQLNVFLNKIKMELKLKHNLDYKMDNVVKFVLQKSRTECGVWCLIFIKSKLLGYKEFWILKQTDVPFMKDYRKQIFR